MDRDEFDITVYCPVCEHYQALKAQYSIRHGGLALTLTDEEVIRRCCLPLGIDEVR